MNARRLSWAVLAGSLFLLAVVAAVYVPWHPVPGGPVRDVAADSLFSTSELARADRYARWARVWSWSWLAASLAVSCWLGFTTRGRRIVQRVRGPWWLRVVAGVALVVLAGRIVALPFAVGARRHVRDYGLSDQPWPDFARDQLVAAAVSVVALSLVMLLLVGSARRWARAWPVAAAGGMATLVMAGSYVYPVLVEPLFNSFTPLPASPLRSAVLSLAEQEGVAVDDVLVADASRRTTTLNAYVSGFGGTRRVVLYDNLVNDLPEDQALSVVAHELAHAAHDDVLLGSLLGALGAAAAVGLLGLLVGGDRLRRSSGVPYLMALVALGSLLASPLQNEVSRQIETRADVAALQATQDRAAFVEMQRQLALRAVSDPTPPAWSQLWFGSHPTVLRRVAIAERVLPDRS